jgi:hypothetical protein
MFVSLAIKTFRQEPDPAGSVISLPHESGSVIQDYGSALRKKCLRIHNIAAHSLR